ncbi:hypothetical protein LSG31_00435 [Fodinisporobacter ferrooxydans]|uniref:Uncharacterized protein n=1 Tax=Fodinisporobacter ferrooxydans TaxID=2901836 RepID=A0ABY4CK02_9BACL|nr:hypothetical protein LSG31_00435 [Alicyclobacillaceae bacterium MYW30-H2]
MPWDNSTLNISSQEDFIRKHGEWVSYSIGMKCSCTGSMMMTGTSIPDANRANPNCQACKGIGLVWIDKGQIFGVVENITQSKELLQAGIAAAGDLILLPDLQVTLSDYDKIQLTWPEGIPFEGELIIKGSGTTDSTMYGVMSVSECISVDPTTGVITNYIPDVDFTWDKTQPLKQIIWQGSNVPSAGSVYSIKYQALMDWIVFTPPQPRRERGTNLGQRVILRKKHFVTFGV